MPPSTVGAVGLARDFYLFRIERGDFDLGFMNQKVELASTVFTIAGLDDNRPKVDVSTTISVVTRVRRTRGFPPRCAGLSPEALSTACESSQVHDGGTARCAAFLRGGASHGSRSVPHRSETHRSVLLARELNDRHGMTGAPGIELGQKVLPTLVQYTETG